MKTKILKFEEFLNEEKHLNHNLDQFQSYKELEDFICDKLNKANYDLNDFKIDFISVYPSRNIFFVGAISDKNKYIFMITERLFKIQDGGKVDNDKYENIKNKYKDTTIEKLYKFKQKEPLTSDMIQKLREKT